MIEILWFCDEDKSNSSSVMQEVIVIADCDQCDQKKLPNVYKSCPKMISLEKL